MELANFLEKNLKLQCHIQAIIVKIKSYRTMNKNKNNWKKWKLKIL
jgi:hypothetical protein